jgi:hypothetical protein
MDGPTSLLPAAILLAALAFWIRALFISPSRSKIEVRLVAAGCVALAAGIIQEVGSHREPDCRYATRVGETPGATEGCKVLSIRLEASGPDEAAGPAKNREPGSLRDIDSVTAVYDIAAHTVYLPSGEQLEAHSGLGSRLDDPRYVHEHMKGPTPPNTYELIPREKPFHGVRALRLLPVGNQNIFGRRGLLAHTYMLGPKGDSNGCVVFKNYRAFLQAFEAGEVKRLLVVPRFN